MHVEKNIAENILRTFLQDGLKDSLNVHLDMKDMGIRPNLWPQEIQGNKNKLIFPMPPYSFTKKEENEFFEFIQRIKVPTGYSASLQKHVLSKKLLGMKTHDYHVFLQQLLPLSIRHSLSELVRSTIMRLSLVFRKVCAKEIDTSKSNSLFEETILVMCLLEKTFPPSFFDITTHLLIHVVEQVKICGPVSLRWMYPFERNMKVLKQYVKNKARPEGSMAEGYIINESLGFFTEYISEFDGASRRVWDEDGKVDFNEEKLKGNGVEILLDDITRHQAHLCVLENSEMILQWRE